MYPIHAVWTRDRRLHLWAEDADAYERLPQQLPRRLSRKDGRPSPHPFAVPAEVLAGVVDRLALGFPSTEATLDLALPSRCRVPEPSPRLPVTPQTSDAATPAVWTVGSRAFGRGAMLDLLTSLATGTDDGLDPSLDACVRLGRLAVDLVARARIVPIVVRVTPTSSEARWVAGPGAGDLARMYAAARSLPGSLRCVAEPVQPSAFETVEAVVDALVDALVRRAIGQVRQARWPGVPRSLLALLEPFVAAEPVRLPNSVESRLLGDVLDAWRAAVRPADAPVRVVFRLHEPPPPPEPQEEAGPSAVGTSKEGSTDAQKGLIEQDDTPGQPWRLEILLGGRDDPSLLVPADQVWRGANAFVHLTKAHPEDLLLADLGRATHLYPPLEPALMAARPVGLDLDVEGAYRFLRDGAPTLAEAGFGVQVPGWWRNRRRRLGLRLRTRRPRTSKTSVAMLGVDALLAYDWQVAIGDATLSAGELQRLAELKQPLVRVRGEWVELPPQDVSAALEAVKRGRGGGNNAEPEMTIAQALRTLLGIEAGPGGLPVVGFEVDPESPIAALLDGHAPSAARPLPTPEGFGGQLRHYQERGLGWLSALDRTGFGACLADDMGLGKTPQLLALLLVARAAAAEVGGPTAPTLLVCPMSVVGNWQREAARFAPGLGVIVHHGPDRPSGETFADVAVQADLVITTYAIALRDQALLATVPWRRVVLDEAQAIKNSDTAQSKAIRGIPTSTRIALTGTPVENRLTELWSIMDFLNPGLLGSERQFRDRFAVPIETERDEGAAETLRRLTGPFILRRVKTDPAIAPDLPSKIEITVPCNLTREQASLYQATVNEMLAKIERADREGDDASRRGNVLAAMTRLKQVCNHPAHLLGDGSALPGRSGKLSQLEIILGEVLAEGDRALIFTQFAEWGVRLREHLRDRFGREVLFLHGGVTKARRDEMVARFQSGVAPIFLLSLRAGGTGLNLTAANHVIHFDRWWNPAVEDQASDRAYRIGQTRNVQVRVLVCGGTIEERIAEMMAAKRDLVGRIVGVGERWLTEMSTAELRELLALSSDAVAEVD